VLIGLFQAWVPRHRIERHLGHEAGLRSHFFSVLLAGTTVGGLMVAFPVALALRQKGARYAVIFSYLETAGVVRIPMTLFEMHARLPPDDQRGSLPFLMLCYNRGRSPFVLQDRRANFSSFGGIR